MRCGRGHDVGKSAWSSHERSANQPEGQKVKQCNVLDVLPRLGDDEFWIVRSVGLWAKKFCSAASDEISASCVEIYRLLNTLVVYGSLAFLLIHLARISRPSSILLPNSLDAQCFSYIGNERWIIIFLFWLLQDIFWIWWGSTVYHICKMIWYDKIACDSIWCFQDPTFNSVIPNNYQWLNRFGHFGGCTAPPKRPEGRNR